MGQITLAVAHSHLSIFQVEACGYCRALYALRATLTSSPLLHIPHCILSDVCNQLLKLGRDGEISKERVFNERHAQEVLLR